MRDAKASLTIWASSASKPSGEWGLLGVGVASCCSRSTLLTCEARDPAVDLCLDADASDIGFPPSICERARLCGDLGVPCFEEDLDMADGAFPGDWGMTRARPRKAEFSRSSCVGICRYGEKGRLWCPPGGIPPDNTEPGGGDIAILMIISKIGLDVYALKHVLPLPYAGFVANI